jgi:ABC-type transporter Mla subunit MlaD
LSGLCTLLGNYAHFGSEAFLLLQIPSREVPAQAEGTLSAIRGLLNDYSNFGHGAFLILHVASLVVAAALFAKFLRTANSINRDITPDSPPLIEAQRRRKMEPLEEIERYFDVCTTTIILIGLAGTMYGFVQAIPHLGDKGYDLGDLKKALTTSLFGIFWALLVIAAVHLVGWFEVDPIADKLREKQSEDPEFENLRRVAMEGWDHVAKQMDSSAKKFSDAADRIAQAMSQTGEDTRNSIKALDATRESSVKAAGEVTEMLRVAMELPEAMRSKLDEVTRESIERLGATTSHFDESLRLLERIPATFRESFEGLFTHQRDEIGRTMEEYRAAIDKLQLQFADNARASQLHFSASLDQTISVFAESVIALRGLPAEIGQAIRKLFEDQMAELRAAQDVYRQSLDGLQQQAVAAFVDGKSALLDALAKVADLPARLDEKLGQFAESQRGLAQAMSDEQRARMAELFAHAILELAQLESRTKGFVEQYHAHVKEDHDRLTARLQSVVPELVSALIKEMGEAAKPITESAAKLDQGFDVLFAEAKVRVQDAVTTSLSTVTRIIEDFRDGLRDTQQELPASVRTAQEEVIRQTVNCADTVSRCAEELNRASQSLPQALNDLRPQIQALNAAASRISYAAADFAGIQGVFDRSFEPFKRQVQEEIQKVTDAVAEPVQNGTHETLLQRLSSWLRGGRG